MQIYQVGPSVPYDLKDLEQKDFVWFIHWYQDNGYDGEGLGAALRQDGNVEYRDLGHCSCYGPIEYWSNATQVTLEEFLKFGEFDNVVKEKKRNPDEYDTNRWQAVVAKVKELSA